MEQFVTHLRAELRKLGDEDDAAAFRAKGGCAEVASVPASLEGLMGALRSSAWSASRLVVQAPVDPIHSARVKAVVRPAERAALEEAVLRER
jgi:hypothetical protein